MLCARNVSRFCCAHYAPSLYESIYTMTTDIQDISKSFRVGDDVPNICKLALPETLTRAQAMNLNLSLAWDFTPFTGHEEAFIAAGLTREKMFNFLRSSTRDEAKRMMKRFDNLHPREKELVTIDHLIAAEGMDANDAVEIILGQAHRQGATIASMMVAVAHPDVMRSAIEFAKDPEGFNDRKMVLQTGGSVAVPKNIVNSTYVAGNYTSNKQVNVNAPSLEDIVRAVDGID